MKNTSYILRCEGYAEERKTIVGYMGELVEGWQEIEPKKKLALVIDCACTDGRMAGQFKRCGVRNLADCISAAICHGSTLSSFRCCHGNIQ